MSGIIERKNFAPDAWKITGCAVHVGVAIRCLGHTGLIGVFAYYVGGYELMGLSRFSLFVTLPILIILIFNTSHELMHIWQLNMLDHKVTEVCILGLNQKGSGGWVVGDNVSTIPKDIKNLMEMAAYSFSLGILLICLIFFELKVKNKNKNMIHNENQI